MTKRMLAFVLLFTLATTTGCVHFDVPDKFLTLAERKLALGDGRILVEAVAADDAQLRVRTFRDHWEGDLSYWRAALLKDLVDRRGYTLVESQERTDGRQRPGQELTFDVTHAGMAKRYLICVFSLDKRLRVVELVAPRAIFDEHVEAVRTSIATMR